jgi:hypothetical protein
MSGYRAKPLKGSILQRGHPLARGLIGAWLFNEGAGPKVRDGAGRADGTLTAFNFTAGSGWAPGPFGRCLLFDGTDDYVTVPHAPNQVGQRLTVSAWINRVGTGHIIVKPSGPTWGPPFAAYALRVAGANLEGWIGAFGTGSVSVAAPAVGTWAHVAMAYDGATNRLYVNGVQVAATAAVVTPASTQPLVFGVHNGSDLGEYFAGRIEIRQLAADPFVMFRRRALPIPLGAPPTPSLWFPPRATCATG